MTTPEKSVEESLERIAERLIRKIHGIGPRTAVSELHHSYKEDCEAIVEALRARDRIVREQCAKIAENAAPEDPERWNVDATSFTRIIATAIRDLIKETQERVATPPVSVKCAICAETIYLSSDKWFHLNTGGRRCPVNESSAKD